MNIILYRFLSHCHRRTINNKNIELRWGKNKILHPRAIAELFNSYFVESVDKLADQISGTHATYNMTNLKINTCPQYLLIQFQKLK
jgi:hypothetical protein